MTDDLTARLAAIDARAKAAGDELDRLCESRMNWRWSIPANPERDSDLILSASIEDIPFLLAQIESLRDSNREVQRLRLLLNKTEQERDASRRTEQEIIRNTTTIKGTTIANYAARFILKYPHLSFEEAVHMFTELSDTWESARQLESENAQLKRENTDLQHQLLMRG